MMRSGWRRFVACNKRRTKKNQRGRGAPDFFFVVEQRANARI